MGDPRHGRRSLTRAVLALATALAAGGVQAAPAGRLIAALEAQLVSQPSATVVLQRWCARRRLADPPAIVARRIAGVDKPADTEVRALLRARPGEPVGYRRVALACGRRVLSVADNWYRPAELTPAMNAELAATEHPFGLVVRALRFHRVRLEARALSGPRRDGVIRQRALLETPAGTPFSYVVETYTAAVLDGGP
jgi:hypothetical protein